MTLTLITPVEELTNEEIEEGLEHYGIEISRLEEICSEFMDKCAPSCIAIKYIITYNYYKRNELRKEKRRREHRCFRFFSWT